MSTAAEPEPDPEGTQLAAQLGDAVGGPEVPADPETETVDLRRKLWNVQRLGESLAESGNLTIRGCGEQVLATLGDAAEPDEIASLRRSARILANIVARNHQVMEAARIEMRQNGPHAAMQWVLNSLPDVWDDDETAWDGKESAEAWFDRTESFYRAAQADAEPAVPPPPVAAALDRQAVREIVRMAIGKGWNTDDHPAAERVTVAVWPLLEHAQAALADNEGIRLWMLDCGELVDRARGRAEAAEGKLAEIGTYCRQRPELAGAGFPQMAADILAIIGSEEEARNGR